MNWPEIKAAHEICKQVVDSNIGALNICQWNVHLFPEAFAMLAEQKGIKPFTTELGDDIFCSMVVDGIGVVTVKKKEPTE